uniref:N-alpha-acetyltransferase 30 n=1 Tax=Albugo laibachii Nc14 TaxID=890382 RepID=F0WHH9_9STRA|nr:acetyltransferase (GNAT) family protein putative [Albugo laibachii Nc14]|eukprot:CCA20698.1 acetyltransferase (GNAT) family protein putative [Albugo laibachii Nc14]
MTNGNKRKSIVYSSYKGETQLNEIMRLIEKDLSEPYSIFTYRYFLYNWPELCVLAHVNDKLIGAIICRQEASGSTEDQSNSRTFSDDKKSSFRGYIAMLAVEKRCRKQGIGSTLVTNAIDKMISHQCDEVFLETEVSNKGAMRLYENLGFVRDERLVKYYLNGGDAYRLKLWVR